MLRWCIFAFLVPVASLLLFARSARAELRVLRVPVLPALLPERSASLASAEPARDAPRSEQSGIGGAIARTFERSLMPPVRPMEGPRSPERDAVRERDATSLGSARPPPMSMAGLALAGGGLVGGGATRLGKVGNGIEIGLGPALVLGGGGLVLSAKW
jgi:hypothetical protein